MNRQQLVEQIFAKKSFLCVGLDTDLKKVPAHILKEEDPIFAFNKQIIDATAPYCVSYKPNLAFYEAFGVKGLIAILKSSIPITSSLQMPSVATSAIPRPCMPAPSSRNMMWTR